MNKYYPIFLNLSGRNVLVIGGGEIARRKVESLLKFDPKITVVSPHSKAGFIGLIRGKKVKYIQRPVLPSDLEGKELVFSATDDPEVNRFVASECRKKKCPVNVVDQPGLCSFIVPAVVKRGDVVFAVSTGGASPALAKFLRIKIEKIFKSEIGSLARSLQRIRKKLLNLSLRKRKAVLGRIIHDRTLSKIRQGRHSSLKREWNRLLK